MNNKKGFLVRFFAVISCICVFFSVLSGCTQQKDDEKIKVGVLAGTIGIGAVKLMKDSVDGVTEGNYDIQLYETANVSAMNVDIMNGTLDIAAMPINAAANVYNKSGAVQIIATCAYGVFSVLSFDTLEIETFAELKGMTIHTTGQGAAAEYILRYLLTENGLDPESDVTIEFYADGNTAAAKIDADSVAFLPEPATTVNLASNSSLKILFDVNTEWDKVSETKLIQSCFVVNKEFAEKYPQKVDKFLEEYRKSAEFVVDNIDAAADLVVEFGIIAKAAIAKQSIPRCNIACLTGNEMKTNVEPMMQKLYNINPKSIGESIPETDFYYIPK